MATPDNTPFPPEIAHAANHWHPAIKPYPEHLGDDLPSPTCPPARPLADNPEN
ncbi:hypothetical protein [Kitasatospora brasiliensis]|uniref:hypothetical protein n=1 Tax=Kitasatospora brasiliensis TaxID=3058040 RepID=UPI0029315652|nr:hypothetical protein [Kitasatospora sp. K002]